MRKVISVMSKAIIIIGFFVIAGSAGASDLNTIGVGTAFLNGMIGLTIISGGVMLGRIGGAAYGE